MCDKVGLGLFAFTNVSSLKFRPVALTDLSAPAFVCPADSFPVNRRAEQWTTASSKRGDRVSL